MPEGGAVVVCMKVAKLKPGVEVPGSKRGYRCRDCKAELSIAPAGQGVLARDPAAETICVECALKLAAAGEVDCFELAPGAAEELLKHLFQREHRN